MTHRLAITGITGRMGTTIARLAHEYDFRVVAGIGFGDYPGPEGPVLSAPVALEEDPENALAGAEALIDFSGPEGFRASLQAAQAVGIPMVSGSTGLEDKDFQHLDTAASHLAVLHGNNMSPGINLMAAILPTIADALGTDYNIEIVDIHHNQKKDAPSGTAVTLADAIQSGESRSSDTRLYGRKGLTGARPQNEIGIHALRAGDIIGDHTVYFCGPDERIELVHRAHSRDIFARGALRAASFLLGSKPGRYTMRDVLGLSHTR